MSVERFRSYRPLLTEQIPPMVELQARLLLALAVGIVVSQIDPAMLGILAGTIVLDRRE